MADRTPLIRLAGVNVTLGGSRVLHGIDWELFPGQHWGILGDNGSGKSTFLRLVRGDLWPDQCRGGSRLYFPNRSPQRSPLGIRQHMGLVSNELQERYLRHGWNIPALDVVLTGPDDSPLLYRQPDLHEHAMALQAMADMGMREFADRFFLTLSQGEARKVLLARALCAVRNGSLDFPSVLLLDEAMDGLDKESRASLAGLVQALSQDMSILATAHRHDDLPGCLTHLLVLEGGRAVFQGPASEYGPGPQPQTNLPAMACPVRLVPRPGAPRTLVDIRDADVYLDRAHILHSIDWRIRSDEHWFVTGHNGSGKSTLMRLLTGAVRPALGGAVSIRLPGEDGSLSELATDELTARQRCLGYVSAELHAAIRDNEHFTLTGLEVVLTGFFATMGLYDRPTPEMLSQARQWLVRLGMEHLAERTTAQLSSGQFRRLLLARALAGSPLLLILDEPCSGLDHNSRMRFLQTVDHMGAQGVPIIFASHYADEMPGATTHVLELARGRVTSCGPITEWNPR